MVSKILETLETLSVADLRSVIDAAEALVRDKIEGERRSFIEETQRRAASLGLDVRDLLGSAATPAKRGRGKARNVATRAKPAAKYRGPNGQEWSGRGRPPRWLVDAEAQGKQRSAFAL
jgi:DNA-binding protein H-NS